MIKGVAEGVCFSHLAAAWDAARGLKQDAESLAPSSGSEPKSTGAIPESPQQ